jgi:hypothetical protein
VSSFGLRAAVTEPRVPSGPFRATVIIPAYNLARFLPAAIESALDQEPCGGPVQIVVIDDGSTDETGQVLERYRDRIQTIRTDNAGLVCAVNHGLAVASGEFIALLDADDEWPADRLRRHIAFLEAHPSCGLVHGDMVVIDADGATLHPSFFAAHRMTAPQGRVLGHLLRNNFVSGGASTFRASLLPAVYPIARDAAYPDWWLAACIAAVAEISTAPGIANRYRWHGGNMGLGADQASLLKAHRRELPWRRWMMRELACDETVGVEMVAGMIARWREALALAGLSVEHSVRELLETDPAAAARDHDRAMMLTSGRDRCHLLARALSHDPFDGAVAADLDVACERAREIEREQPVLIGPPLIELDARPRLVLAWLPEIIADPSLLSAFAASPAVGEETLVVLAARGDDLGPLIAIVEDDPALQGEHCDLQVIYAPRTLPGRRWLAARAGAVLGPVPDADADHLSAVPPHPAHPAGAVAVAG